MAAGPRIRLPRHWSRHVKADVPHAISLASVAISYAGGHATGRRRLRAQLEQANTEIALLREELNIEGCPLGAIPIQAPATLSSDPANADPATPDRPWLDTKEDLCLQETSSAPKSLTISVGLT